MQNNIAATYVPAMLKLLSTPHPRNPRGTLQHGYGDCGTPDSMTPLFLNLTWDLTYLRHPGGIITYTRLCQTMVV
jgi:hypothetical protein